LLVFFAGEWLWSSFSAVKGSLFDEVVVVVVVVVVWCLGRPVWNVLPVSGTRHPFYLLAVTITIANLGRMGRMGRTTNIRMCTGWYPENPSLW
jgi:hypothetical protein